MSFSAYMHPAMGREHTASFIPADVRLSGFPMCHPSCSFALVVFEPVKVDLVDLGRDQRSIFEKQGDGPNAGWTERRVVP